MDARLIAAKVVQEVTTHHQHLDQVLGKYLESVKDPREKSLARELSYGVMRWYDRLTYLASLLLKKPFRAKDADLLALVCSGLYQLAYMRIPDHAAISATVETARSLGKPWACELINAVLRRYQREKSTLDNQVTESESALYSHPDWMIARLRKQWPEHWQSILNSNNEHPPLQLRVNLMRHTRAEYLQQLEVAGIEATPSKIVQSGITLSKPVNVEEIPGFNNGSISVQDFGAQLAVYILNASSNHRVLDACAAPGGKTGHILETTPEIKQLIAVESDPERMSKLRDNINRLKLNATLVNADVNATENWWDGEQFDCIFLDAPCSASGVIRRHPDIKYLRTPEHIPLFSATQSRMLESLWPLLKPEGRLVYSTCSIFQEETEDQIATFTKKYDDVGIMPIDSDWGVPTNYGRYILPGQDLTDGFYYSLITKNSGQ